MPTSKKPRKRYNKKPCRFTAFNPDAVKTAAAYVDTAELAAYVSLQNGTATRDQMTAIRDVFNLATALWALRREFLTEYGDGMELMAAAAPAIVALIQRNRRLRGQNCDQFAGTAAELRAIQSAVAWCADVVRDRIQHEYRFVQTVLINLVRYLSRPDVPPLTELTEARLREIVSRPLQTKGAKNA